MLVRRKDGIHARRRVWKPPPMPYVSLDLETTGLDPEVDEIIEVAAVRFDASGVLDRYQSLVNPGKRLEYRIALLTGIDPAQLGVGAALRDRRAARSSASSASTRSSDRTRCSTSTFLQRKGVQIYRPGVRYVRARQHPA